MRTRLHATRTALGEEIAGFTDAEIMEIAREQLRSRGTEIQDDDELAVRLERHSIREMRRRLRRKILAEVLADEEPERWLAPLFGLQEPPAAASAELIQRLAADLREWKGWLAAADIGRETALDYLSEAVAGFQTSEQGEDDGR